MRKLLIILSLFITVSVYADSDTINSDQAIADCARENKNCDKINSAIKNDIAKTNRVLKATQHEVN